MTNSPFIRAEEAARKGFDFTPWGGLEGFLKASQAGSLGNSAVLKRMVPDLARAVDMTATAISSLPFEIVDEAGETFDTSQDWQNKLGGIGNPQRLIYLIASSLCGGAAYVIPTATNRAIVDLQYVAPHTITEQIQSEGLKWFDRASDQGNTDHLLPEELIYFWLPDSDVEIGKAQNHPLGNAALDAQMIWAMKNTLKMYGDRGFVPITLLGASGMPNEAERQKSEKFFDRLLKGGFDVLAKIVNADALTLIPVGAGMEQLKQSYLEIRRDAKESIADSFGIPSALFMSDNAFASEFDALRLHWYTASRFVQIYQTIQETLTEQLLKQYGKKMVFKLETLDIFQEDEAERSKSLSDFVIAVSADPAVAQLGMELLGYDLSDKQKAALAKIVTAKDEEKKQAADLAKQAAEKPVMQPATQPTNQPTAKKPSPTKALDLSADELKDLALWYSKAKAWHLKGKGNAVDWECKYLREDVAAPIRLKLAEAQNELDIADAFKLDTDNAITTPAPAYKSDIMYLADAMNNYAAKATVEAPAPQPNVNITMSPITLTAQMPEQGSVIVNVPEQAAPVVNVTNEVQPTPVTVKNDVTVQPADVTIQEAAEGKKQVKVKVKRDMQGRIESAEGVID